MTAPRDSRRAFAGAPAKRLRLIVVTVAASALMAAAIQVVPGGRDGASATAAGTTPAQAIVVTSRWGEYRPTCGPRHVGKRLRGFSRALRKVKAKALRRYWGRRFAAFGIAVPGTVTRAVESYEEGLAFLRRRHGLRVRFRGVQLNGGGGVSLEGAFRSKESGRVRIHGKAELSCKRPTIIAMAIWATEAHGLVNCPDPSSPVPQNAMIVCDQRAEARPSPELDDG